MNDDHHKWEPLSIQEVAELLSGLSVPWWIAGGHTSGEITRLYLWAWKYRNLDSSHNNIPRKGAKQVIYYGAYSQAWRERERRQGILPTVPTDRKSDAFNKPHSSCSRCRRQLWAALLKKVWDVDALKCPKCCGRMKVISFIEQPSLIRRILTHLDL